MKLTTYTDYALRTLMFLGSLPAGTQSSVNEISVYFDISRNHLVKVVAELATQGYILSSRGKNGGIRLAKQPNEINIGAVIRLLENNLSGIDCQAGNGCKLIPVCQLTKALSIGMEAFLQAMEQYHLSDLIQNSDQIIAILNIETRR